jgi:hypothetical protein
MPHSYAVRRADLDYHLDPYAQLVICIIIDVIGIFTAIFPVAGWAFNIVYAPIEALFIYSMLSNDHYVRLMGVFGLIEQIIPIVGLIPGCSIAWLYKYWR